MTTHQLARGYLRKCEDRLAALDVLVARQAWSDVVRESQEIVELALKGLLRMIGVDPPKWHDVGDDREAAEQARRATAALTTIVRAAGA